MFKSNQSSLLERIATALERMAPAKAVLPPWHAASAFVWQADGVLQPVASVNALPLDLLLGIDHQKQSLLHNTLAFAAGKPANNALLWGARGTGKSSLVKAVQQHVFVQHQRPVVLVDIHREDIGTLPQLLSIIRKTHTRVIIFCDDLSFSKGDSSYKSLKAVLEGGVEGRPDNAVFYATSNRRHLLSREMIENEQSTAIMPGEAVEENVSLSDRFGLWLGFHHLDQATYLSIVEKYAAHVGVMLPAEQLHAEALEWSATRGARSGRVAWQFITDLQSKTLVDQH